MEMTPSQKLRYLALRKVMVTPMAEIAIEQANRLQIRHLEQNDLEDWQDNERRKFIRL